jgi:protein ImuB
MPHSPQSLPLFAPPSLEAPRIERTDRAPVQSRPQLWLAVCLPSLALECLPAARSVEPAVVVEARQGQSYVIAANREATKAGINPGHKLGTATALAASLQIFERAPHLERASLESLARWAERLTSLVSIESSEGLLLEVAGSLKLFGSLEVIKARVRDELATRAFDMRLGVAPTATAALWLARGAGADTLQAHELASRLNRLPLEVTHWPPAVQALLKDLGLKTVGDCARLPRDGFARRVGNAYLAELDRALGRCVDLRAEYRAPCVWGSRIELDAESADCTLFMEVIERLLDELAAELRKRQAQIDGLSIAFEHLHRPPTIESFALLEPTHERERLLALIGDRLTRRLLPVPAVALQLRSAALKPLTQRESDLFETKPLEELVRVLLERLRERFGTEAVYGLRAVAEHRPERAWAKSIWSVGRRARDGSGVLRSQARPLWLLARPKSFAAERASFELSGPERIESGWWDECDVERDYYTAKSSQGQRLWVFRDRRTHDWFLHGFFG